MTGETGKNGTKTVETMIPLKYLSNFWTTIEITSLHCEINLDLNWPINSVIVANNTDQLTTFVITDTKVMFRL